MIVQSSLLVVDYCRERGGVKTWKQSGWEKIGCVLFVGKVVVENGVLEVAY